MENIQINMLGMCDDCIALSLDDSFWEEAKQAQLAAIEARQTMPKEK